MKFLVSGARGYIGTALLASLRKQRVNALPLSSHPSGASLFLDLAHPADFDYSNIQPGDTVLLTGAISSPDICAREPEYAHRVNVEGTSEFIKKCQARDAQIIFFSSDTVYGEREREFDESASTDPAGDYARMKNEVEARFLGQPGFKTIRLSYVFSKEDKFAKYIEGCARRNEEAEIFHPFDRAVIHRDDVVEGAISLGRRWAQFPASIVNFGGPSIVSRIEFAQTLKDISFPELRFKGMDPPPEFFIQRPRVIRMRSPLLTALLERSPHSLEQAVKAEFLDEIIISNSITGEESC